MDGTEPILMLGPCVIESEDFIWSVAEKLGAMAQQHGWRWIFKASYDKANRSAISSYRGLGCEAGCRLLARIGAKLGVPVTTDVHSVEEAVLNALVVNADMIGRDGHRSPALPHDQLRALL